MPKFAKAPKIIVKHQLLPVKWNHRVLPWCVVTMKCFTRRASQGYLQGHLVIGQSYFDLMRPQSRVSRMKHCSHEAICTLAVSSYHLAHTPQPHWMLIVCCIMQYNQLCMAIPYFVQGCYFLQYKHPRLYCKQ